MRVSKNGRRLGHIIGTVYLLHFARKFRGKQHYMGFTTNLSERLKAHKSGRGAPLVGAVAERGIGVKVARTWKHKDGFFEQRLKRSFALPDLCPTCSGAASKRRAVR
jgi:hypothetical protein